MLCQRRAAEAAELESLSLPQEDRPARSELSARPARFHGLSGVVVVKLPAGSATHLRQARFGVCDSCGSAGGLGRFAGDRDEAEVGSQLAFELLVASPAQRLRRFVVGKVVAAAWAAFRWEPLVIALAIHDHNRRGGTAHVSGKKARPIWSMG
jgi:hypothetical protein